MTTSKRPGNAGNPQVEEEALTRGWRRVLSVLILVHVAAVFIAPFTFASSPMPGSAPPSPIARILMSLFQPYIDALFLDHGYAFFAPDPGPPHLFRARLEYDDGRPVEELTFPDRQRHRPRLLYHRHFMLSERLYDGYRPPVAPPQVRENPEQLVVWRQSRWDYESYYHALKSAYERHLRERHGASRATLIRVEHRLFYPDDVIERHRRIDDPETYDESPEDRRREELP